MNLYHVTLASGYTTYVLAAHPYDVVKLWVASAKPIVRLATQGEADAYLAQFIKR